MTVSAAACMTAGSAVSAITAAVEGPVTGLISSATYYDALTKAQRRVALETLCCKAEWGIQMKKDCVDSITLTAAGTYTGAIPTVTIAAPSAGGINATAYAELNSGGTAVTKFAVRERGSIYGSVPTVTVSAGGATGTAVLGYRYWYDLPVECFRVSSVWSDGLRVHHKSIQYLQQLWELGSSGSGSISYYSLTENKIWLYPQPAAAGQLLVVRGYKIPETIGTSDSTTALTVPPPWDELVILRATIDLCRQLLDDPLAIPKIAAARAEYNELLERCRAAHVADETDFATGDEPEYVFTQVFTI